MELDRTTLHRGLEQGQGFEPPLRLEPPRQPPAEPPEITDVPESDFGAGLFMRRLIGDIDIRNVTPRHMAEASMDLYVAGVLPWEDYAVLAFQPELHPNYDRTIGALTGEKAEPDRPRDFLAIWEDRLKFDEKYNADSPQVVESSRRIVTLFRQIDVPINVIV